MYICDFVRLYSIFIYFYYFVFYVFFSNLFLLSIIKKKWVQRRSVVIAGDVRCWKLHTFCRSCDSFLNKILDRSSQRNCPPAKCGCGSIVFLCAWIIPDGIGGKRGNQYLPNEMRVKNNTYSANSHRINFTHSHPSDKIGTNGEALHYTLRTFS